MDAGHAEREAQRRGHRVIERAGEEVVVERAQPLPVRPVVGARGRARSAPPRDVGHRPLGDDAQPALASGRQHGVEGLLVGDAHGDLQGVEAAALDRPARRRAIAAVADVAGQPALPRRLQGGDGIALLQHALRARVQLHEVERVGAQALEAALDGLEDRPRPPVVAAPAGGVADLREEVELAPPSAHRASDQRLAVRVALGGVDHVQAGVEGGVQQPRGHRLAHALVADLAAAEAERGDLHVGASEPPPLHQLSRQALARQLWKPPPASRHSGSGITRWSASAIT